MSSNKIEQRATHRVNEYFLGNDFITSYITENDKTPSWDGDIYLYSNAKQKSDSLIGKIPTQVKGTTGDITISNGTLSFPVQIVDLRNYLKQGILYFVVKIEDGSIPNKIHFKALTPMNIKEILESVQTDQKSKNLHFKELSIPEETFHIFLNTFLENCNRQTSFTNNAIQFKDLFNKENLEKIEIYIDNFDGKNTDLFNNEHHLYAKFKDFEFEIPIYDYSESLFLGTDTKSKISIDDTTYYESVTFIDSKENFQIHIGSSFKINLYRKKSITFSIDFSKVQLIDDMISDMVFVLQLLKSRYFNLDKERINIPDNFNMNIQKVEDDFSFYRRLIEIIDFLKLDKNSLNLLDITQSDYFTSNVLYEGLIRNQKVTLPPVDGVYDKLFALKFINYKILLHLELDNNKYVMRNMQDMIHQIQTTGEDNTIRFPFISIFSPNVFSQADNIQILGIAETVTNIYNTDPTLYGFDQIIFNMIFSINSAIPSKKQMLSKEVFTLIDYAKKHYPETPIIYHDINKYQVIKRCRDFNDEELIKIGESLNIHKEDKLIEFSLLALLGKKERALDVFSRLDDDLRIEYKYYPLFDFVRKV